MNRILSGIGVVFLILSVSCTSLRNLAGDNEKGKTDISKTTSVCDSLKPFNTLYLSKIDASIMFDEEEYESNISLYYIPDSIIYISAVNVGFEIIRAGIMPDSIVYINRLDKLVYIYRESTTGYCPPATFNDLQLLFNRPKVCTAEKLLLEENDTFLLDRSVKDVSREIFYRAEDLVPKKFEFFHKKTGEYVVGEGSDESSYMIYSNYIIEDVTIRADGGKVEFDREININLEVNKKKYDILYF